MLNGFDRAVGPVQPGERPVSEPYKCQPGMQDNDACAFQIFDGGIGRMYLQCDVHNYTVMAVDWTAVHFGGGPTLAEHMKAIRERFDYIKMLSGARVDADVPSETQQRFFDVFEAIAKNLDAVIVGIAGRENNGDAETNPP